MILVLSKMSPSCQKFSRHHLCMAGDYLAQPCTGSLQRSENCSGSLVLGPEISLELHLHPPKQETGIKINQVFSDNFSELSLT